jgi:hypothetical protein
LVKAARAAAAEGTAVKNFEIAALVRILGLLPGKAVGDVKAGVSIRF